MSSVGERDIALNNEIIRVLVGSGLVGMAIEGTDDRDEMGVYIETPEQLLGLAKSSEHYIYRDKPNGVRSQAGDLDLTLYSLRKFVRLAVQGNPSILTLLYAEGDSVLISTDAGDLLQGMRESIVSKKAGYRFLGYLDGQRERMVGGGKQNRVPNRPELIAAHGYDTKYASHALRLGLQGLELLRTGRLTFPMNQADLDLCMEVKRGKVPFNYALDRVDTVRALLEIALKAPSPLPDEPVMADVNEFLVYTHQHHWKVNHR